MRVINILALMAMLTGCTGIPEGITPVKPFEVNRYCWEMV